ncbi:MAG: type II toxin-antitoxin system VapC family toxin [Bifidobacteriaceae bacterium]|nr:type II toxin-antitoxin system VapC family toxin [Bifidobacteriaceae bacterium]
MIGLDTNVLVRFIMEDDPAQTAWARQVINQLTPASPAYVSTVTLVELWWVLGRSYGRSHDERCSLFGVIADSDELVIGDANSVGLALEAARKGADFADALICALGRKAGCKQILTFDAAAALRAGMTLVDGQAP